MDSHLFWAEFAYDALRRRIWKRDCVVDVNDVYYYNDKWQVLCQYPGTGYAFGDREIATHSTVLRAGFLAITRPTKPSVMEYYRLV